jgi:hypothetical protein
MIDYLGIRVKKDNDFISSFLLDDGIIYHLFYYQYRISNEILEEYEKILIEKNIKYSILVTYGSETGDIFFGLYEKTKWLAGDEVPNEFIKEIRKYKIKKINNNGIVV